MIFLDADPAAPCSKHCGKRTRAKRCRVRRRRRRMRRAPAAMVGSSLACLMSGTHVDLIGASGAATAMCENVGGAHPDRFAARHRLARAAIGDGVPSVAAPC
jgi:hypothetical protein